MNAFSGFRGAPGEERRFACEYIPYNLPVLALRMIFAQPISLVNNASLQSQPADGECREPMFMKAMGRPRRARRVAGEPRARNGALEEIPNRIQWCRLCHEGHNILRCRALLNGL